MSCAVLGCKRNNKSGDPNFHGFSFPKEKNLLKQWIQFCKREDPINLKSKVICDAHFKKEDFENNLKYEMGFCKRRILKAGSVPTIDPDAVASKNDILREKIMEARARKKLVSAILHEQANLEKPNESSASVATFLEMKSNTDKLTFQDGNEEEIDLKSENKRLQEENDTLKQENLIYAKKVKHKYLPEISKLTAQLMKAKLENKNIEEKLLLIFTKGQIKKIKNGNKRQRWTEEDIERSFSLYTSSARTYKLLRRQRFPMPSIRTLRVWTQNKKLAFLIKK